MYVGAANSTPHRGSVWAARRGAPVPPFIRIWLFAIPMLLMTCAAAQAAPSAVIRAVRLMPRADLSTAAWSKSKDTYSDRYVHPRSWAVQLNGCGSRDPSAPVQLPPAVPVLLWRLEPLEGQPHATAVAVGAAPGECATDTTVPALGRWRVTLTARDGSGETATATTDVVLRDLLVAAIGDSFASGEGNKVKNAGGGDKHWIDPQCHRSYQAWPAVVARSLENDTTAVTYLSFACSGSDVSNLIDKPYEGVKAGATLDPQIEALRKLLGDPVAPGTRPVDVLLGATGINTIPVASLLLGCVEASLLDALLPGGRLVGILPECQQDFTRQFDRLPSLLDDLELALSANLRIGQVQFVGYPARIMTDAFDNYPKKLTGTGCSLSLVCTTNATLCNVFANTRVSDKQWMTRTVDTINAAVANAGNRNGWTITQTRDLFRGHGYCTPPRISWFRSFAGSLFFQGDYFGTAHPTSAGHSAISKVVRPRIRLDAVAPTPDQFVINIKKLAVTLADQDLEKIGARPHQVGPIQLELAGAAHATCGTSVAGTPPQAPAVRVSPIDLGTTCKSFLVSTAGKRIQISASANVRRFIPRNPPIPGEPDAGHAKTVTLHVQRLHLRANNWNVTFAGLGPNPAEPPVQRLVAGSANGQFGRLELQYTITKPLSTAGP